MIVKDGNSGKEYVKILDFGESHKLPPKNTYSDILRLSKTGTPMFMAPEIKRLNEIIDESAMIDGCRADIYSLGLSIISLL